MSLLSSIPPPLPIIRQEPLLRGPLILTAFGRVLLIPFYLILALGSSLELRTFFGHFGRYLPLYLADRFAAAGGLWSVVLLSMLLAWLFFSRRRMFRPLIIYFCALPPLFLAGFYIHMTWFPDHHQHPPLNMYDVWVTMGVLAAMVLWPFYYVFSPRVKRVFTR